jgi:hypothetical protein
MKMTARSIRDALLPVFPNLCQIDDFMFLSFDATTSYTICLVFPDATLDADNPNNDFEYDIDKISFQIQTETTTEFTDVNLSFLLSALLAYSAIERK